MPCERDLIQEIQSHIDRLEEAVAGAEFCPLAGPSRQSKCIRSKILTAANCQRIMRTD